MERGKCFRYYLIVTATFLEFKATVSAVVCPYKHQNSHGTITAIRTSQAIKLRTKTKKNYLSGEKSSSILYEPSAFIFPEILVCQATPKKYHITKYQGLNESELFNTEKSLNS